jgi:CD164 antigen
MIFVKRPVALALLAVAATALSASAQTSALNPTVKVLARPQSPVPAECATDVTMAPAIEPEPQPAPDQVITSVPPSNDLRASMRRLQVAAEGDDYAAFKAALVEARRAIAAHPAGGERNAANEALQVFVDIGRVWDYAMASPAGSFFDGTVQGGSLLSALKRYPDYGRTIAGETLTVGDKTLYPTSETRRFLARESSRRLARLGVSTPARVAQGAQPEAWPHRPTATPLAPKKPTQAAAKTQAKTKSTPKTAQGSVAPKPHETKHKPVEKTAKATPKPKTPHIESTPVPKAKPAPPPPTKIAATTTVPTGPPIVTTTTAAPLPPPVPTTTTAAVATPPPTTTTAIATTTTAAPPTDTTTTTSALTTSSTDTSATAAPDTATTSTAPPAEKQNGNMNLLLAVVLILVGIGVLVVLFRASD